MDTQDRTALDDALADGEKVGGIAGQSIWVKAKKLVAGIEQAKGGFKLVAASELRSVADVGEHDDRPEAFQHVLLGGDILPLIGTDPRVSQNRVKEAFDQDRAFAEQVVRTLGWPELLAARPKVAPRRMPMLGIRAIECSISHSPPRPRKEGSSGKPRRSRVDRDALPYYVTIQVFDAKSKGLSDPAWRGAAQLRTPERARIDARKKDKLTSLSSEYATWIENEVIPVAEQQGLYVGFLMDKQAGQGTYFHEFQVILIHRQSIESRDLPGAMILSVEAGALKSVTLPHFDKKASKGPLKGNFVLQSRGATPGDFYANRITGPLSFT